MRVRCREVSKAYPTRAGQTLALAGVTFETRDQEFVSIVGPSGCGKTTLLAIVAGLTPPTAGEVVFEGEDAAGAVHAMVFQEDSIFPWMTVLDNVAFPLAAQGVDRRTRRAQAHEILARMGLDRFAAHFPGELSVGMKQRVGIARAFVRRPTLLLMDEPFGALDAQMKAVLQEQLIELWGAEARTVLYVTHDLEEALFLGDRVLVMSGSPGRIKADIPVPFPRPRRHALRADPRLAAMKEEIWGLIRDEVVAVLEGGREGRP